VGDAKLDAEIGIAMKDRERHELHAGLTVDALLSSEVATPKRLRTSPKRGRDDTLLGVRRGLACFLLGMGSVAGCEEDSPSAEELDAEAHENYDELAARIALQDCLAADPQTPGECTAVGGTVLSGYAPGTSLCACPTGQGNFLCSSASDCLAGCMQDCGVDRRDHCAAGVISMRGYTHTPCGCPWACSQ
jgi:hypothetical protein